MSGILERSFEYGNLSSMETISITSSSATSYANHLNGGAGNDTAHWRRRQRHIDGGRAPTGCPAVRATTRYYVDAYSDRVIENAGEGTDSVFASATTGSLRMSRS